MTFLNFYEIYEADVRHRVKETTWENKETMVKTKIIPFFGERKMIEISAKDVRHWQKEMIEYRDEKGKSYSQSYLATLHAQLSAIFNHAVKFYDLKNNPAKIAGSMGSKRGGNIMFWTQEQYKAFIECVMDKPLSKRYFQHEKERGSEMSGVPKIRLHDLRHSHVSLLINMGFSALEIAERMGHESVRITYQYYYLMGMYVFLLEKIL